MTIKSAFFAIALLFTHSVFAKDLKLSCTGRYNLEVMMETEITLGTSEKNKFIGEFEGFQFFVSSISNDVVELQAYNMEAPSRSYATAKVTEAGSFVDLSIWTREFIIDARCTL